MISLLSDGYRHGRFTKSEFIDRISPHRDKLARFAQAGYYPTPGQIMFHTSPSNQIRESVASAGRRAGKTHAGANETADMSIPAWGLDAMRKNGILISKQQESEMLLAAIVIPEGKNHKAAPRKFIDALIKRGLRPHKDFTHNKTAQTITIYKNGSDSEPFLEVQIKAVAADPDKIRSEGYVWVWFDEAGFLTSPAALEAASPALADHNGLMLFTTSPGASENNFWFYDRFIDLDKQNDYCEVIEWWTEDNIHLSRKVIERSQQQMAAHVFNREYRATWEIDRGNALQPSWLRYYQHDPLDPTIKSDLHTTKTNEIDKRYYDFYIGVDPAISVNQTLGNDPDFTTAVVLAKDKETGIGYIIDMRRERITAPEQLILIEDLYNEYNPISINIEAVAYQQALVQFVATIPGIRQASVIPVKTTTKKDIRLNQLGPVIKSGVIKFNDKLSNRDSGGKLVFEAFFEELKSFPHGKHDDTLDALDIVIRGAGMFLIMDGYIGEEIAEEDRDMIFNQSGSNRNINYLKKLGEAERQEKEEKTYHEKTLVGFDGYSDYDNF